MGTGEQPSIASIQKVSTAKVPTCDWAANNSCMLDDLLREQKDLHAGFQRLARIVKDLHETVDKIADSQKRIEEILEKKL